jgi:hypothetical protein
VHRVLGVMAVFGDEFLALATAAASVASAAGAEERHCLSLHVPGIGGFAARGETEESSQ